MPRRTAHPSGHDVSLPDGKSLVDPIHVITSRGVRIVTRQDLGDAINGLANKMQERVDDVATRRSNVYTEQDILDAKLLLRINPDYDDLGLLAILRTSGQLPLPQDDEVEEEADYEETTSDNDDYEEENQDDYDEGDY